MDAPDPLLTLAMIVRDEAAGIEAAINSARPVVDEIVVVDTGSVDQTPVIAAAAGAEVAHWPWTGDFSEARNHAASLCRTPWVLILDGDEQMVSVGDLRLTIEDADRRGLDVVFVTVVAVTGEGERRESEHQPRAYRRATCSYRFPVHNQLRGYGHTTAVGSSAVIHATYAGSMEERKARALPVLHRMLAEAEHGSEEWCHALHFLSRTHAMVSEWEESARYAERVLEERPTDKGHAALWVNVVRAAMAAEDRDGVENAIEAAIDAHPGLGDLWWYRTLSSMVRWTQALEDPDFRAVPQVSRRFVGNVVEAGALLGWTLSQETP